MTKSRASESGESSIRLVDEEECSSQLDVASVAIRASRQRLRDALLESFLPDHIDPSRRPRTGQRNMATVTLHSHTSDPAYATQRSMIQALDHHHCTRRWYAIETPAERQMRGARLPVHLVSRQRQLEDIKHCRSFATLPFELQLSIIEQLGYFDLKSLA